MKKILFAALLILTSAVQDRLGAIDELPAYLGGSALSNYDMADPAEENFYGQLSQSLGDMMSSPEGFEEFNQLAGEALQELMADPDLLKQNPELEQLQQTLQQDPDALRSYMENFRDVMKDPAAAKELFQTFGSLAEEEAAAEAVPVVPADDYSAYFKSLADAKTPNEPVIATPQQKELPELTRVEIAGDWKDTLLDRASPLPQRRAALRAMVRDFDKAYKTLYRLQHSMDPEQEHLSQKCRRKIEDLLIQPGGVADYAAALWTATTDEASSQFFLENFSGMGSFLEELVDFDISVKELAKIAKLAAKDRLAEDQLFELGKLPKMLVGREGELEVRAAGLQEFAQRLSGQLEVGFSKEAKLAELLRENKHKARKATTPEKSPGTERNMGKSWSGSGGDYGEQANGYAQDYAYPYGQPGFIDQYNSAAYQPGSLKQPWGEAPASTEKKDREFTPQKAKEKATTKGEPDAQLKLLIGCLKDVGKSSPESADFFVKVEQVYNFLELVSEGLEPLLSGIRGKEETKKRAGATRQEVGGLVLKQDAPADAQAPEQKALQLGATSSALKLPSQELALALAGAVKSAKMLATQFAFPLSPRLLQANAGAKSLLQPPRPIFYFAGQDKSSPAVRAKFAELETMQDFNEALDELAEVLIATKPFADSRKKDLEKIIAALLLVGAVGQNQFEQELEQALLRLEHKLKSGIVKPRLEVLAEIQKLDFFDPKTLANKQLGENLELFSQSLEKLSLVGLQYKIFTPFNLIIQVQHSVHDLLKMYQKLLAKLVEQTDKTSLAYLLGELKQSSATLPAALATFYAGAEAQKLPGQLRNFMLFYTKTALLWSFEHPLQPRVSTLLQMLQTMPQVAKATPTPDLEELTRSMLETQRDGGFLSSILSHPIVQFITAGLGVLGVWKVVDLIKSWWQGSAKAG